MVLCVPFLLLLNGCSLFERVQENVSDEDIAKGLKLGAEKATKYGLKLAMDKNPDKADEIAANAALGAKIVRENILPALSGADTGDVLRSAVETALAELTEKLSPSVIAAVQLAINLLAMQIEMPENPADKLSERTRGFLVAFFEGLGGGLDTERAIATRNIGPPKLVWPKN